MRGEKPTCAQHWNSAKHPQDKGSILGRTLGLTKKPENQFSETNVSQPPAPRSLMETGIKAVFAVDIFLKSMFRRNLQTLTSLVQVALPVAGDRA